MEHNSTLDELYWRRFSDVVEMSYEVSTRQQFFVWAHGVLQGLVPHEILICGAKDSGNQTMLFQHFCGTRYFKAEHFQLVCDPELGLLPHLQAAAKNNLGLVLFSPSQNASPPHRLLHEFVAANEMKNLAVKLITGIDGQTEAFYGFARVSAAFDERLRSLIELSVPHIHSTFLRVLGKERESAQTQEQKTASVVTPRQVEILRLVRDGKTNAEIAQHLGCSQWTIKNHVQNILRRLDSSSRAHALVRAMRLGILRPE